MSKILITGANGFIGRSLSEALRTEFSIVSANRNVLDLMDSDKVTIYLKESRFDVVIHTATYDAAPSFSTKDPQKVLENNLQMFFNIARCNDYFRKMIYFGSGAEFSKAHWKPKMEEGYFDTHIPKDQYGFSKYIMSKFAAVSTNIYNLRLFGVFGKYDDWRYRFIPNICCQAVLDMPITINKNSAFDFLFIDDLIRIVKWFVNNQPLHHIYNVCSGNTYDFIDLARKIVEISGKKIGLFIKNEGQRKEYSGDNSLLLKELKNFQFTPISDSMKRLYLWYERHRHLIDKKHLPIS